MKEFLLLIRNEDNYWSEMQPEQQQMHMAKAGEYIHELITKGILKTAQPLTMNGAIIQKTNGIFKDGPFVESKEVIGGFFHILAENMSEAVEIARAYPLLDDPGVRIEVREMMPTPGVS